MAFSQALADRVRDALERRRGLSEKTMFGGLGFFLNGNMMVGVWHSSLIVRLGEPAAGDAMKKPDVRPFDITGKAMKGWALIEPDGLDSERQLKEWVQLALDFVSTLPAKESKQEAPKKKKRSP